MVFMLMVWVLLFLIKISIVVDPTGPSDMPTHPLAGSGVETTFINSKQQPAKSTFKVPPLPTHRRSVSDQGAIPKYITKPEMRMNPTEQPAESHTIEDNAKSSPRQSDMPSPSPRENINSPRAGKSSSPRGETRNSPRENVSSSGLKSYSPREKSSSPISSAESPRGRPKDKRTQKLMPTHFPMLQGLMATNKAMSPKLPEGRPKGREVVQSHSPSPVRKNKKGYFVYPDKSNNSKQTTASAAVAREIQNGGADLFDGSSNSIGVSNTDSQLDTKQNNTAQHDSNVVLPIATKDTIRESSNSPAMSNVGTESQTTCSNAPNELANVEVKGEGRSSPRGQGEGRESEETSDGSEEGKEKLDSLIKGENENDLKVRGVTEQGQENTVYEV